MDLNAQKQEFSVAWLTAVAAAAGFSLIRPAVDDDSVDAVVFTGKSQYTARPEIHVQLKASAMDAMHADGLHFALPQKNYDDLCRPTLVPHILVVLRVPSEPSAWLIQNEVDMLLRHCAWWTTLRGMPANANATSTTVVLPRERVLTPQSLVALMARIDAGGWP